MVSIKNIFKRKPKAEKLGKAEKRPSLSLAEIQQVAVNQFRGVNWRDPATLPLLPKIFVCLCVVALAFTIVWIAAVGGKRSDLQEMQQQEETLKQEFIDKSSKVANLEPLRKQRRQAEEYVVQLEKQLPAKAEMEALLSDINQAGIGRNVQFEIVRPGTEEVKTYYGKLPVAIRVSGKFADIAAFAADVAHMSRIVTLSNLSITEGKNSSELIMEATANTYRYLDKNEKPAQNNAKDGGQP